MMAAKDDEEEQQLRTVALQNAQAILLARRQAEEALRKQSEWLRVTLSSIGDAVISTDAEGRVTFLNGVAEDLTGWSQTEALGRPLPEIFHIVDERTRQPVDNPALRALRGGTVVGLANHTILLARDGTERPIDDSAAPMRDESGACVGTVLVFRDVTDRKRSDEAAARLAAIVESSEDAIISKSLDGVIRSWNVGAERLFGYTVEEAVGQSITLIIPPERIDEERTILGRLRRGERVEHFETVRVSKDGHRVHISLTVSPIRDDEGHVIGASKIARDITERKQVENALRESEARYRAIVEATPECVKLVGSDGTLLQMNAAGLAMIEAEEVAALGQCMYHFIAPEDRDAYRSFNGRVCRGEGGTLDFDIIGLKGTRRHMETTAVPLPDPAGGFSHLAVTRDVTVRRREAALLDGQKHVLELIARGAALPEVLAALCRLVEEQSGGGVLASFLVAEGGRLRHGAAPSLPDAYNRAIDGLLIGPAAGSCGTAAFRREPVYVSDIAADPLWEEYSDLALGHGLRACWSQPILTRDRALLGTFAMYDRSPREPGPEDLRLVDLVVRTAGIAIERARTAEAERRLLAEVEAERGRLEEVFRLAPSFMAVLRGPDQVFERVNDRYIQLVGGRELIGRTVRAALPEVTGQGFFEILDQAYRTGEPFVGTDVRVALRRGSGPMEERILEFVYQPMRDTEGTVSGILVHGIDLTDRKRAEADLARMTAESDRRRRLYETALSNTPDLVYVFGLDHRFTYANEALLAMWGRTWEDAIGKTCLELGYEPWHSAMHDREIDQVVATRRPIRGEVPFAGPKSLRIFDYIFVPVIGASGEVEAVAGTTRDVTERKAMEDALREADRQKDEFLALLAHELRSPLAPLSNGLQVLRLADRDVTARASAREMMERQLGHMVRLIDDLLDISRIGRNKMELRRSRIQLSDVVNNAVETARPMIEAAGHELIVSLPPEPVFLDADLTRLAQVFGNLLTNSAKYTPPGGYIQLAAERRGDEVFVSVRDNGIGIPAESLPTIFDMFSQVDRSIERATGGLGIGLALVKGLVEMHGGAVWAESGGTGRGSRFTVRLPALRTLPRHSTGTRLDLEPLAASPKRRVLVVDDNQDSALSMAGLLKLLGNETRTANDGVEAVAAAEAFRPEVILMDVGMPRLNGYEATRRIREQAWGRSVTIIALTGWGQEGDRLQSIEAGCDGHLVKPVEFAALEKILTELGTTAATGARGENRA
jgi:PAS domain S-box-containing protein